jgi:aminoglycoside phosphotransferase (APT) family kinase protein
MAMAREPAMAGLIVVAVNRMPAAEVEVSADLVRVRDAALAAAGYDGPPVWLHGDLHPANLLVNDGRSPSSWRMSSSRR